LFTQSGWQSQCNSYCQGGAMIPRYAAFRGRFIPNSLLKIFAIASAFLPGYLVLETKF
jgi:hypothetical protein